MFFVLPFSTLYCHYYQTFCFYIPTSFCCIIVRLSLLIRRHRICTGIGSFLNQPLFHYHFHCTNAHHYDLQLRFCHGFYITWSKSSVELSSLLCIVGRYTDSSLRLTLVLWLIHIFTRSAFITCIFLHITAEWSVGIFPSLLHRICRRHYNLCRYGCHNNYL